MKQRPAVAVEKEKEEEKEKEKENRKAVWKIEALRGAGMMR